MKKMIWIGLDVHAQSIAMARLDGDATAPLSSEFPNDPKVLGRTFKKLAAEGDVRVCYEAGPCGYEIYRQLSALGVACVVVAPSLVPRKPGDRIKTDRRDAAKLVRLYRAGELTPVWLPTPDQEGVRDGLRARDDVCKDRTAARHRLSKLLDARLALFDEEIAKLAATPPAARARRRALLVAWRLGAHRHGRAHRAFRSAPIRPPAAAHGLPWSRAERILERGQTATRIHYQSRQRSRAAHPRRGGVGLTRQTIDHCPPKGCDQRAAARSDAHRPRRHNPTHQALCAARRAWEETTSRRHRCRARARRIHVGIGGGAERRLMTRGVRPAGEAPARKENPRLQLATRLTRQDSRSQTEAAPDGSLSCGPARKSNPRTLG
jgi:Transposase